MTQHPCRALWLLGLTACHSYSPEPVDLAAHAREFAARLPDAASMRAFLPAADADAIAARIDLHDGLDRAEGRLVAAVFHPDCRLARRRVATALAARDHSGRWQDPELQVSFERILETVPHQWLASASLGLGLPINGRLAAERAVADEQLLATVTDLRLAEEQAVTRLDGAWVQWSCDRLRADRLRALCEQLRTLETIARRLADAGANTELDARQFVLERLRREAELERCLADVAIAALELAARLGLAPEAAPTLVPDLSVVPHLADPAARAGGLAAGPRLAGAAAGHAVAERELALQIKKQWPDLQLAPGWAEEDGQPRATLGLSLPLPLFSGNDAAIAAAEAHRAEAAETWRAAFETARHDLALAERRLATAKRQQELVTTQLLPLAERQLDDGRRLAELGTLDPFLLLDALLRVHDANLTAIDEARRVALATITCNTFTWLEPLARATTPEPR